MRGIWIEDRQVRYREDLPAPEKLREGDVRVEVSLAGICATDLALRQGYMGFRGVPGHEFCGVALEGGLAGRRVVGEINAACGSCATCEAGLERHCPHRSVLGILNHSGAFAEELCLPEANLLPIPDGVSDEEAVFTEPLAAALEITEQIDVGLFERRLVLGDGRLGLLCAQALALDGGQVELVGRHPERGEPLPPHIRHRGNPEALERYDLVVEATGAPEVLARAIAATRPRGTLVLKTTSEAAPRLDLAPLVVDEITLLGSRCGPFHRALEVLAEGKVVLTPWIEARLPLSEGPRGFEQAAAPGVLKVLLDPARGHSGAGGGGA